jgi:hypothetical protein
VEADAARRHTWRFAGEGSSSGSVLERLADAGDVAEPFVFGRLLVPADEPDLAAVPIAEGPFCALPLSWS